MKKQTNTVKKGAASTVKRWLSACSLLMPALFFSTQAHAFKLSGLATGWKAEAATIVPVVLLIIMGIGVLFAGFATISGIIAKKNQEPLRWQLWGIVGGAIAIVIPIILLSFAGSITSEQGNANSVMSELKINY